jgi:cobalt-zinc-cadmium efflux system outer membrane protein
MPASPPTKYRRRFRRWIGISLRSGAILANCTLASANPARGPIVLTSGQIRVLARQGGAEARVARARTAEASAWRVGSQKWLDNPDLSLVAGPRFIGDRAVSTDVVATLVWPFNFSGSAAARRSVADQQVEVAASEEVLAQQAAVQGLLSLWLQADAATRYLEVAAFQAQQDATLACVAQARQAAGQVAELDVLLARMVQAQSQANLDVAKGEHQATREALTRQLGLARGSELVLDNELDSSRSPTDPNCLIDGLDELPILQRARAALEAAQADTALQDRLGQPVPRLSLGIGRSIEDTIQLGIGTPLPVYQRNQTSRAVARARTQTRAVELATTRQRVEADLLAAYARYVAAQAALKTLEGAAADVADVELLSRRAYQLGQVNLAQTVTTRREAAVTRVAQVRARMQRDWARLHWDLVSGALR